VVRGGRNTVKKKRGKRRHEREKQKTSRQLAQRERISTRGCFRKVSDSRVSVLGPHSIAPVWQRPEPLLFFVRVLTIDLPLNYRRYRMRRNSTQPTKKPLRLRITTFFSRSFVFLFLLLSPSNGQSRSSDFRLYSFKEILITL